MTSQSKARSVVIDASVLLAFYLPAEPYKAQALEFLGEAVAGRVKLIVPTLTRYEALNVLSRVTRGLKRGQKLSLEDAQEILTAIDGLKLEERTVKGLDKQILKVAHENQCTAYDAAYLALAAKLSADLLTGDERFHNNLGPRFKHIKFLGDIDVRRSD